MASSTSGLPVVAAPNPPTFSYAQAAKGRATNTATSAIQSSQGTSGVSTPAKDATSSTSTPSASINGAGGSDSGERSVNGNNDVVTGADTPAASLDFASKSTTLVDANSSPSSPSFGTASTSTLPKDEELNLTAHPTPASVWDRVDRDRRAQAASALDRPSEPQEGRKGKNRKGAKREKAEAAERERAEAAEKEKEATKPEIPLVAAPLPTVNIWQQRMATQPPKAKASPLATQTQHENADVFQPAKPVDSKRRTKIPGAEAPEKVLGLTQNGGVKESAAATKVAKKGSDVKEEPSNKRAGARGSRSLEKDERASQLPPPVEDAVSWPTPETALEEEKRKAKVHVQEKPEKEEKDETASNKAQPKQKWHPVPFTPSVTFNTPLPQRGGRGRGGGRGGREAGSRGSHVSNGSIGGDKPLASATSTNPTEVGERGRDNPSSGRAASLPPSSSAKPSSDGSQITGDQRKSAVVQTGEKPKAGPPNSSSKGEPRFVTDARLSNGAASESAFETQKSDNTKPFKQDQTQSAAFDNQFNLSRAERRSESNIRGSEQMKDNTAFSRDGQQARDGRADRGRGGYRGRGGFPNGQHPQHGFANGHGPSQSNGYTLRQNGPYSPPLQPPFSNQPYVQTPSRGRGGNTRSQSIPNVYGARYPNGNGSIAPLQTSGSMYDYPPMQPMSAMPYPYVDTPNILQLLRIQIAYYFSLDNLLKDTFLRNHMDSQGFVLLSFIAGFRRIEALTHDFELLRFACQDCENVEIIKGEDNEDRLRRKEGWEHWVMPIEDRDESAKCEGPKFHYRVQRNQPMGGSHAMSPQPFSPNGNESGFQQFPAVGAVPLINGNGQVLQTEKLSAAVPEFAPAGLPAMNGFSGLNGINGTNVAVDPLATDTQFTDEEVFNLTLVFNPVAKASDESKSKPFHHASSRTFSNGSIDGGTIDKINDEFRQSQGLTNGSHAAETSPNSNGPATSFSNPQSPTSATNGNGPRVMWKKGQKQQAPIPEENTEESYLTTREKALRSREVAPAGETPVDMKVLYEFWSHFLCRNFNPTMYREFRQFALEDLSQRNTMDGINNLISYYDETLHNKKKTIPEIIAQHYIELVKSEDANAERPAFSKLRAALQGSSIDMKSRKRIEQFLDPDSDLKAELER